MKNVIILIPIYRNFLEDFEQTSLYFAFKNLTEYKKLIISPLYLKDDNKFNNILENYDVDVKFFKDSFFDGFSGYNKLLINLDFYKYFMEYKYMFIYQLDALVLSDNLEYWLNKDYDYIGAPWLTGGERPVFDSMGNGGFSLRKIDAFIKVLESKTIYYSHLKFCSTSTRIGIKNLFLIKVFEKLKQNSISLNYLKLFLYFYKGNEDYFWSFIAQYFVENFMLATPTEALEFAFEGNPRKCFEENKFKLPFGVHAWQRHNIDFWIEHFPEIKKG